MVPPELVISARREPFAEAQCWVRAFIDVEGSRHCPGQDFGHAAGADAALGLSNLLLRFCLDVAPPGTAPPISLVDRGLWPAGGARDASPARSE